MSDKKKRRDDVELEEKKSSKPPAARAKSKEPKSDMERAVEAAKAKKALKQARGDTGDSDPDDLFGSDDEDKMPKRATRQVTSKPDVSRDWLVTLFDLPGAVDAEGDAETCCISCCCPCIGVAQAQTYIKDEGDEACLQAGVLYCFMSPLWCCWCGLVRGAYRETVGIEGNGCFDCLAGCFLPCCASAQMIRDYHAARQQGKLPSKKKKKSVGRVRSKEQVPREEEKRPSRKPQTDRSERPREAGAKAPLSARDEKRPRPAATTAAAASAGSEHSVSSNRSEERKKYRQEKGADSLSPPQRVKSREGGDADRRPSSSQGSGSSAPKKPAAERKSSQTKADDDSTPAARSKSRERDDAGPQRASTKKSSDSSAAPRSKSREPDDSGPSRVQSKKASSSDKRKS